MAPAGCCVRLIELPKTVEGLLAMDKGHADIYLNVNLSHDVQLHALRHELDHIARNDMYNSRNIHDVEA